jgi:hypothetical protein
VLYPAGGAATDWFSGFSTRTLTEAEKEQQRQAKIDAMNAEIAQVPPPHPCADARPI